MRQKQNNYLVGMLLLGVIFSLLWTACSTTDKTDSAKGQFFKSIPFYKEYVALDTSHLSDGVAEMEKKYPSFAHFYLDTLLGLDLSHEQTQDYPGLKSLLTFRDYRNLFDTVLQVFPDTRKYDQTLGVLFSNIHEQDSAFKVPTQVYYMISYLTKSVVTYSDTVMGIGLDMFLGRDFEPYAAVGIPYYATTRFTPDNIPVWAAQSIYENRFPFSPEDKNLLDLMVYKGKEALFIKEMLPDVSDNLIFGFTPDQMKWCENNEATIYNFILQNKLLYQNRMMDIMRFVVDGPNTPGFAPEAPGNLGTFIGWKIVTAYFQNNKESLEELFQNVDAQSILQGSKYKPR